MPGFRRAQLRGSEELFRTTDEPQKVEQAQLPAPVQEPPAVHPVPSAPDPGLRSVRLSEDELQVLADAVQHLKFPHKPPVRPSVDDFERLEALRQKLLEAR